MPILPIFLLFLGLRMDITDSELLPHEKPCPKEALVFPEDENNTEYLIGEPDNASSSFEVKSSGTCPCLSKPCIALCCPPGYAIIHSICQPTNETGSFPQIYKSTNLEQSHLDLNIHPTANGHFHVFIWDPCHGGQRYRLDPMYAPEDDFRMLDNGSLYYNLTKTIVPFTDYCLAYVSDGIYSVVQCYPEETTIINVEEMSSIKSWGLIASVPFLIVTFLVYSYLPELNNMHGLTLRAYVAPLTVAFTILAVINVQVQIVRNRLACSILAFVIHFSFLSSFFWLNVMCFDIWWTFGGFRGLEGSVQLHERKKFIIYSVYAWGCASIMTGLCIIMDYAPGIPDYYIKPKFGEESCWFSDDASKAIYFYGPMGLTVICNICLFISTALKILKHKRDTATQLQGTDSRRHDDNKQWFNLYLKLFIVMGINWAMEIISWLLNKNTPDWVWYLTDLTNTLQGVIIFIIFVWKDRIKNLLMKRFGCSERSFQSRNSTRSGCNSSISTKVSASTAPLQDKNHFSFDKNRVDTTTTDESDFV